ncbi:MAG: RodZ domain-containing protein [Pseudomonadota bacterium]
MELRGFDAYEITLGDEMRGERASLGKSLEDVERDLKIKAPMIVAIENCDVEGFPNPSVVAGYVRCYARYLGLDADSCYARFCDESGFQSPYAMFANGSSSAGAERKTKGGLNSPVGNQIAKSRFAAPPMPTGFRTNISLGGVFSTLALMITLGGVSYGGYAVLQDIQRVGFEPLVEAPDIMSEAPAIAIPNDDPGFTAPDASAYLGSGALAGIEVPPPFPEDPSSRRDGPISAIDPQRYGVFARPETETPIREGVASGVIDSADDAILAASLQESAARIIPETAIGEAPIEAAPLVASIKGIAVHAAEEAWVRVTEGKNITLFEGILVAGQKYDLPDQAADPVIRAGNAGGVYLFLDGIAYGPIGDRGRVVKNISLSADTIRESFPRAESIALAPERVPQNQQRAAVDLE